MSIRLRIAALVATVVLITGILFFLQKPGPSPVTGETPSVVPGEEKSGGISHSATAPEAGQPPAPVAAKVASAAISRTPDPRLPAPIVPIVPKPASAAPVSRGPGPVAVNPAPTAVQMPAPAANLPATKDEREAVLLDLDKVTLMLRDFRTVMGENPTGTNAEIMKALMGDNPKGARLGPPENQGLNANGELIDRWGTPLFFHQLSRTSMEIRSAGPDRMMYTEDDIITH